MAWGKPSSFRGRTSTPAKKSSGWGVNSGWGRSASTPTKKTNPIAAARAAPKIVAKPKAAPAPAKPKSSGWGVNSGMTVQKPAVNKAVNTQKNNVATALNTAKGAQQAAAVRAATPAQKVS